MTNMMLSSATLLLCLPLLVIGSCEKSFQVVEEFDAAHVSHHYQVALFGMDLFSLRSKPVLSLLKERSDCGDQNEDQSEVLSDFFSLDWDKLWSEKWEPVYDALKQNPHFVAAVCFIVAIVRGMRRSVVRETIEIEQLVQQVTAALSAETLETHHRIDEMSARIDQVTRNQDVIARAFARVISILRGSEPLADPDQSD